MEDDAEILDWGHEEEGIASNGEQRSFAAEDAEDAVSLGGDEEDEFLSYRSRVPQDTTYRGQTPPRSVQQMVKQDGPNIEADAQRFRLSQPSERAESGTPSKEQNKSSALEQSPILGRTHSFGKLMHALPPKPVVSSVPFVHPSHPSIIEATAMASRSDRDKRNGGSKSIIHDSDPLPPGWEIRHPRSGHGIYYYNVRTEESTWTRPTSSSTREKRDQRSDARDDLVDRGLPGRSDETLISRVGRLDGDDLSYDDRHYRPGENGRRDDRATTHTYIMTGDSYVPDLDSRQNGRSSPVPSRLRDNVRGTSSRRPASPNGLYGDPLREASAASTLAVEDRIWVARDVTLEQRPTRRPHDTDPAPANHERRNPPRDSDRSSTLRPRSPTYARDFPKTLHTQSKPTQPISQAPGPRQQSHLSRDRRHSEIYNDDIRRARADDTSSTRLSRSQWTDEYDTRGRRSPILRTGPHSDIEGDYSKSLASDAQRSSRRRTPLPPQSAIFREGSRYTATMAREHGLSVPVSPLEHGRQPRGSDRPANDLPRTLARRSLSPPPMRDADPIDDSRRSRGRVRPLSMRDSYVPHDSSTSKNGDRDVLHINDTPSRISDPPRYPATRPFPDDERADHVPRHPRAMMETPGGGAPRGPAAAERSPRPDRTLPRQSVPNANLPSLSARDRQWVDRPTPVEPNFSKRESTRLVGEVRAPPTAPNVRLSGTNSTPIGNRGRLAASVALPPAPSNVTHRGPIMSGSNAEPVGSRTGHTTKEYEHPPRPDIVDVPPSDPSIRDDMRVRSPASARRTLPPPEAVLPSRPSRLSGTSRFGPPIVKEAEPRLNVSPESIRSDAYFAEEASRATPPPLSRESSAVSIRDAVGISRHSGQLTRRPNSPPANRESLHHMSMQRRVGDEDTRRTHHDRVYSAVNRPRPLPALSRSANYHNNMEVDAPRQWQNTPHLSSAPRRHTMETYVPERSQDDFQDPRGDQFVTQPEPMVQDIVRPETRTPSVHPDRARMLQNGLPPRPPTDLGRSRSGRGQRREKNENENRDVTFGPGDRRFEPSLPAGGQRHPEADVRPQPPANRGGSLLDRLTMEGDGPSKPSSLRDRVQLPSKRDREEMQSSDLAMEQDVEDQDGIKRARRRGAKARKGRR